MTEHLQIFRSYAAIILFAALIGAPLYAQADDINPQIANCEEMQDDATRTQMLFCNAHVGCNMILKLQGTCAKAKGFLSSLKASMYGRNKITNNDVFEANMPALTQNDELISRVSAVQKIVRDSMDGPSYGKLTRKNSKGQDQYYEGELKDGHKHGIGVYITSDGYMGRGQMKNGGVEGKAQTVSPDGTIMVGYFVGSGPLGNIAFQDSKGAAFSGNYLGDDKWSGVMEVTGRNGDRQKRLYNTEGKLVASGPVAKAGQVAITPSLPEPSALDDPKVAGGSFKP